MPTITAHDLDICNLIGPLLMNHDPDRYCSDTVAHVLGHFGWEPVPLRPNEATAMEASRLRVSVDSAGRLHGEGDVFCDLLAANLLDRLTWSFVDSLDRTNLTEAVV